MPPLAQLEHLFLSLFTEAELRRFLAGRTATAGLDAHIGGRTPAEVAFEVAALLSRHGSIDAALFVDLVSARPRRREDIERVGRAFGWVPPAAGSPAPVTPLAAPVTPLAAPAGDGVLRILHLSDLHARTTTRWDADPLKADLIRLFGEWGAGTPEARPDLVALTGDVAWSGLPAEFTLAAAWLRDDVLPAMGLTPADVLVVPGNHDLDRPSCDSVTLKALERALRQDGEGVFADVWGDADQRALLHRRYTAYLAFLTELGVAHPRTPHWAWSTTVHGHPFHFVGLDTALLHTPSAWLPGPENAKGRLVLGQRPLNEALTGVPRSTPVIALAHHPLDWLIDWDHRAVLPIIRARVDVLLRGHLHEADPTRTQSSGGQLVELTAGSVYDGSEWPNGVQRIEIDPGRNEVRVYPYVWSRQRHQWIVDRNVGDGTGMIVYPLR